ncbi:hypothetical protein [Desulfosoma caldarium]|uniref:DUF4276 family protein n=1 Tax=Desulfosoma caldarium TaxID=610254 RepID=A0A3N1UND9_9BACT|nr:hypothetical protein [Desulfosoma caldarium]ROQ90899.1 hypothetical protein EDC27_2163 [Desulfosoma caldarium]
MPQPMIISVAVEGLLDEAVACRLINDVGGRLGSVYGKQGRQSLRKKIGGYNKAARHALWFVLVDLNGDAECALLLRKSWLDAPEPRLCFRVAVRQVEAWLIADHEALATSLGVARSLVPSDPEALQNAKVEMVNLARRSRRKNSRADMVPREGSGRSIGPAYVSRLIEYVERHWRPHVAAQKAESLRRAITCLERLMRNAT